MSWTSFHSAYTLFFYLYSTLQGLLHIHVISVFMLSLLIVHNMLQDLIVCALIPIVKDPDGDIF